MDKIAIYAEKSNQSIQLLNQFINAKMDSKKFIADHISKIILLTQRLKDMNKKILLSSQILSSFTTKYDNLHIA